MWLKNVLPRYFSLSTISTLYQHNLTCGTTILYLLRVDIHIVSVNCNTLGNEIRVLTISLPYSHQIKFGDKVNNINILSSPIFIKMQCNSMRYNHIIDDDQEQEKKSSVSLQLNVQIYTRSVILYR